jgi:hypothetical protein
MNAIPASAPVSPQHEQLRRAMRTALSALREHGPRFALAGSYALWVYGAPEPVHDVDVVVAEDDTELAAATLAAAGFDVERTPEDWLFKARLGDAVVDVLHRLNGVPVDGGLLDGAEQFDVLAIKTPVLAPTAVLIQKLRALDEHHCDFAKLLPSVRAVRERLDWPLLRTETDDNDFAVAFLVLADRLGLTG